MNVDDYRYVVTVASAGSFTEAAKQLFIAQPSLSQRIKHIEEQYGVDLFIRNPTRGVSPTAAGQLFIRYAERIITLEDDLQKELTDISSRENLVLRIGVCNLISSRFFRNLIHRFNEQYPEVQCDFIHRPTAQLIEALRADEIDVAVCYLPITHPEVEYDVILEDKFVFVPAQGSPLSEKLHDLGDLREKPISRELLDGIPFATNKPGTMLYQHLMKVLVGTDVKPDIQHYSSSYSMLFSLAESGIASTILYESFFDNSREHIPYYYLDGAENRLSVVLAHRKTGYLCKAGKKLVSFVRKTMSEIDRNT